MALGQCLRVSERGRDYLLQSCNVSAVRDARVCAFRMLA